MYNTGNEVPSTALEDMADNAKTFDALVTKTEGTTTDRLGRTRRVFQQIVTDMGFNPVTGSFQSGATVTEYNQCLLDTSTGTFYSWNGVLPKVVPAGSTPATAGGVGAGAWVDRTDLMLRNEIESGDYLTANIIKKSDGETMEYALAAKFRPLSNSADAINAAAQLAVTYKGALDLTGVTQWDVNKTIILTGVPVIISSMFSPLVFDETGTYTNGWAVEIGDPALPYDAGRSVGTVIIGTLSASASSRTTALNGIYMKGSWFNVGHVRANNFNGTGIYQDSVWDSTFERVSVELCGNTSTYALKIASNGDTHNASHINSVQVEQAYHKAIYIDAIRDVIDNIHAERCYQLTTNDGSSNVDGTTYLNSYILLGNSVIHQTVMDSATVDAPTGEPIVPGQKYKIIINGNASAMKQSAIDGTVYHTYGADFVFENMSTADFIQKSPAERFNLISPNIITLLAEGSGAISSGNIYNVRAQFNAADLAFFNTKIDNITFSNQINGNISFTNCPIRLIGDLLAKSLATKKHTSFLDCLIQEYVGGWNSICIVSGGKITSGNISSQAKPLFFNVEFNTFNPTGNSGYLTRGCTAATVNAWTYPEHENYPAGTITERVGYNAAGKIYQNTNGAFTWVKIA